MATKFFLYLVGSLALVALACAEEAADPCVDKEPPVIVLPENLEGQPSRVGNISIDQWREEDADGNVSEGATLGASFAEVYVDPDQTTPAMPFGSACFAEVGAHAIPSQIDPIPAGRVQFEGIGGVFHNLNRENDGSFSVISFDTPILVAEGGEEVNVEVEAGSEYNSFPSGTASVTTPPEIILERFEIADNEAIHVNWEPGGADYFEVIIRTESSEPGQSVNRMRCILSDDGCHRIPRGALDWLRTNSAEELHVILKRHQRSYEAPDSETLIEFDVTRSLDFRFTIE